MKDVRWFLKEAALEWNLCSLNLVLAANMFITVEIPGSENIFVFNYRDFL